MKEVADDQRPHHMSQVLTGAMFDIVLRLSRYYVTNGSALSPQAFWDTIQRMQRMAIQPLDLLPPVDVTFRDYALAVLRAEEIANPTDPDDYRGMMLKVFVKREESSSAADETTLQQPHHVFERLDLDVFHDVDAIASSRADAYRFLDDNRQQAVHPRATPMSSVADLSTAQKLTRAGAPAADAGAAAIPVARGCACSKARSSGASTARRRACCAAARWPSNQNGNVLAWARKPGSQPSGRARQAPGEEQAEAAAAATRSLTRSARRVQDRADRRRRSEASAASSPSSMAPLTSRVGRRRAPLRALAPFRDPRRRATTSWEAGHGR